MEGSSGGVAPQVSVSVKEESEAESKCLPPFGAARAPLVNFKDEAENILQSDSFKEAKCVEFVKGLAVCNNEEEPSCLDNAACGVSEAAKLAGLYTAHEVKDELVLGPERPHRPDATLVVLSWALADKDGCPYIPAQDSGSSETQPAIKDCSVRFERNQHDEVLTRNCIITNQEITYGDHADQEPDTEEEHARVKLMCDLCGTRFISNSDLMKHVRIHIHVSTDQERSGNDVTEHGWVLADKDGCPYIPAQDCGSSETQPAIKYSSVRFERNQHDEVLTRNCIITDQENEDHADQEPDTEEEHARVKLMCDICGTRFISNSDLMKHVGIHIHVGTDQERSGNDVTEHANRNLNRRKHSLRECSVTLERLPNHAAIVDTNDRQTNTQHSTTYTDSETDTEQIYTNVDCEEKGQESICAICGMSFGLKVEMKKHIMAHIHMPESSTKQQEDMDVADSGSEHEILKAGACKQKLALERAHSRKPALQDCCVRLERLHSDVLLAGNQRRTPALQTTTHTDTESDTENETYTKLDCEIPTCYLCGESFALSADLIKHVKSHIHTPTNKDQEVDVTEYASDEEFSGSSNCRQESDDRRERALGLDCRVRLERLPEGMFRYYMRPATSLHLSRATNQSLAPPPSTDTPHKINLKKRDNNSKRYTCDICDSKFLHKNHLIKHIRVHLGKSRKPSSAKTSGRVKTHNRNNLTNKISLTTQKQKYKATNHSVSKTPALFSSISSKYVRKGQKSYSCEICNGQFDTLNDFKIHKRLHMGLNVYTCSLCQKKFARSDHYESHKRIHTGERPYSCEICKKSFTQTGNLLNHKRVHTGEREYECKICKKCFMYASTLNTHIRVCHTDIKPYSCQICKKEFKLLHQYKSHKRVHTGETPYGCEICDQQFKNKNGLNNHIQLHTGRKPYFCEICDKRFALQKYYASHKKKHLREKIIKLYSCELCKEQFRQKKQYEVHKRRHTGKTQYTCDLCNKKFVLLCYFEAHKRTHAGIQPYPCGQCEQTFAHITALNYHKQSHTDKTFSCDYCQKTFSNKLPLLGHIKAHISDKTFVCEVCNKRFSSSGQYKRHRRDHVKNKTYTAKCKICHQQFDRLCNFEIHRRIHLGKFIYSCELCDKKFIIKELFEAHERMHTGVKPFICNICDKSFAQRSYLIIHIRVHTGEKPYKCDICHKQFSQCGDWNKHKRIHTGEKRISCEICNKRLANQISLRLHKLLHTGEKPHSCEFCDLKFRHSGSLIIHRRSHTGEKPYSCGNCNAQFAHSTYLKYHKERNCKVRCVRPRRPHRSVIN